MAPGKLTVSVVVPVRAGGDALRTCLTALARATPPPDEVVVAVDGRPGASADADARRADDLGARVVRVDDDGGPARARNLGAAAARGDVLFFVDADVAVRADAVRHVAAAIADGVAAVFGSYDDAPAAANFVSQYKNLFHHYVHQAAREDASTFWAGCGAVRADVFRAVGGFDESYRVPSIEDVELGYRLRARGHRIRLDKDLQATHLKRWTAWSLLATDVLRRAVPWTELILRERRLVDDLNVRVAERLSAALAWLLALCLALSLRWPRLGLVALASAAALLALNRPLYGFLLRRRGRRFLLGAIAWHWFYYLYSSVGFVLGAIRHLWSVRRQYRLVEDVP